MNKKFLKLCLFLSLINILNIFLKSDKIILESHESRLLNIIEKLFDKSEIETLNINDFGYKKTINLNFKDACKLYMISLKNKNYKLQKQNSLERMYSLSPDARLSELILWNLALSYEKDKKTKDASDMFSHFRKLFPGSRYYWLCRVKEIENSASICLPYYKDSTQIENVISLCKQYIFDVKESSEKIDSNVIFIMNNMYLEILKKENYIILSYYNKYKYMRNCLCYYSATQRILSLSDIIYSAIDYELDNNNLKENKYKDVFKKIQNYIFEFQKKHNLEIPNENNFKEVYDKNIEYISNNLTIIKNDIYNFMINMEKIFEFN